MTKKASVDIHNAFIIKELNNLAINKAIQDTQEISLENLNEYALENTNFVVENNSAARYKRELKLIMSEITSHKL